MGAPPIGVTKVVTNLVAASTNGVKPTTSGAAPVPDVVVKEGGDELLVPILHGLTSEGVESLSLSAGNCARFLAMLSVKQDLLA
jgi:hypothetical protein